MRSVNNWAIACVFAGAIAFAAPALAQSGGTGGGQTGGGQTGGGHTDGSGSRPGGAGGQTGGGQTGGGQTGGGTAQPTAGGQTGSMGGGSGNAGYTQLGDQGQGGLQHFVDQAAFGNLAEIELGKLAQQKAQDPQVKQFAQTMIDQHTEAERQLQQIASNAGITVPKSLDTKHQAVQVRLSRLSGSQFDQAYMKEMVKAHQQTEDLLRKRASQSASSGSSGDGTAGANGTPGATGTAGQSGATGGTTATTGSTPANAGTPGAAAASIDSYAAATMPTVQQHLQMAKDLEKQLKGGGRNGDKGGM